MIAVLLTFAIAAAVVYLAAWRMSKRRRLALVLAIFVIPSVALVAWIVIVGGRAPPDAVNVQFSSVK
jgi:cytochrome c oxidase subunit IV